MLFDMLVMKDTTTIAPRQKRMEDVLNNLLVQMAAREGVTGMDELELALPNVVGAMITRINEAKGTTGSSTGVSQAAVPNEQIPEINDDGPGT